MTSPPPPSDKKPGGFVPPPPGYLPPGARREADPEPAPPAVPVAEPEPAPDPAPPAEAPKAAKPAKVPKAAKEPKPARPAREAPKPAKEPKPAKVPKPPKAARRARSSHSAEVQRLPLAAWLAAVPGVVGLVGAVLPWFAPTGRGVAIPKAYCLQAGRVGFLGPLVLIVAAVIVVGPRLGWFGSGQPTRRLDTDGLIVGGAGVAAAVVLGLAWVLLPSSYSFTGTTWDRLNAAGHHLTRGPQVGYLISIAAAALAILCGVLLLVAGRRDPQ